MGKLFRKTIIKTDMETCWDFFSSPDNLSKITPPEMDFVIKKFDHKKMYEGQQIGYTVKPLIGIPVKWLTEIKSVTKNREFVDFQEKGPYKLWHHRHLFKEIPEGIEMTDIVHYKAPFGILGKLMEKLFIQKKVESIFNYREKVIKDFFEN